MLPERLRILVRQANKPGFYGVLIPANIEATQVLINEAIAYANGLKKHKQNAIGLVINNLIWRFAGKRLVIDQGIKGINFVFNELSKDIKIIVKGDVEGNYIGGGYSAKRVVVIHGNLTGDFLCYRMYGNGSFTVKRDLVGDYAASMMSNGSLLVEGSINGMDAGEDMNGGVVTAGKIVGDHTGKEMSGGSITAGSIAGDYVGEDMYGGSIIVTGDIKGGHTGMEMSGGSIKVNGSITGDYTGEDMYGGTITVRGEIIGKNTASGMMRGRIKSKNFSKRL
jgi:formylmethanofuran dehydrogenase subunit C